MLTKPDYNLLLDKMGSKYRLCVVASKRAHQLIENSVAAKEGRPQPYKPALLDVIDKSYLYIALEEIAKGIVTYQLEEKKKEAKPGELEEKTAETVNKIDELLGGSFEEGESNQESEES